MEAEEIADFPDRGQNARTHAKYRNKDVRCGSANLSLQESRVYDICLAGIRTIRITGDYDEKLRAEIRDANDLPDLHRD